MGICSLNTQTAAEKGKDLKQTALNGRFYSLRLCPLLNPPLSKHNFWVLEIISATLKHKRVSRNLKCCPDISRIEEAWSGDCTSKGSWQEHHHQALP